MKISVKEKIKPNETLKGLQSKTLLLISSNYSTEFLYKILKYKPKLINKKDENNETFLSYAIKRKNLSIIELLLTSQILDYSYQNIQGNSYLHLAVIFELESIVKKLIEKGIDLNMKNLDGNTALHYAYSVNNYNIIILLLQNKIDFTIKNNQQLIAEEIKPNSLKKDELIINNNNQINKSVIIDWENNKINEDRNNDNKNKLIYNKVKNITPLVVKKINRRYNDIDINNTIKNKVSVIHRKGKSHDNTISLNLQRSSNNLINIVDYNNTEKYNKNIINNLLDSKQETVRKNIFENKILPSNHQINCHKCDLNYLNSYQNKNLKNYQKTRNTQYIINGIRNRNNFTPLKIINTNERYEDLKINTDRNNTDEDKLLYDGKHSIYEIRTIEENIRIKNKKIKYNSNDIIYDNQKSTNDSSSLYQFLSNIKMEKYFNNLLDNGFDDVNLLIYQTRTENPITDLQLKEVGINNIGDRARILIKLEESANNFGYSLPNEVYYICDNINSIDINEDRNINKLLQWLIKINLEEYLDNFLINGYYSIELLLIQMLSKNPLDDDILKNEIEISKIGHRSRILNKLKEDSKGFNKNMRKKGLFIITGKESKSCDCTII